MPGAGGGSVVAAGQVRRGRPVFQQCFKHCLWSARNGKHPIEDHYRSGRGVYADRLNAFAAGGHRHAFGFAINDTGGDTHAGAATVARDQRCSGRLAGSTGERDGFAKRFEVGPDANR